MKKLYIKNVELRSREDDEDGTKNPPFALVSYASLQGSATRISNEIEVAKALNKSWVEAEIIKAEVAPYDVDFDDGEGMQTISTRNIVKFEGESLEDATKASGHELLESSTLTPEASNEDEAAEETADAEAEA